MTSKNVTYPIIPNLLRLYRMDVAVISFSAYVAGCVFNGGFSRADLPAGLAISLISFNYIYSINSIEDREIDSINKSKRPLPAGKLSLTTARRYVSVLLLLSVIYPLFVSKNLADLTLYLMLPVLGWAYSLPPFRLKTNVILAAVSIAFMYLAPIAIGFVRQPETLKPLHIFLLIYFLLFIISIVPLKDIEDVQGDELLGSSNWMTKLGSKKLMIFSALGLIASIALVCSAGLGRLITLNLVILSGSVIALMGIFVLFQLPINRLYRIILILTGTLGLAFSIFFLIMGESL